MGTYNASLRAIGDTKPVPATVLLEDGQLAINSGDVEIGAWSLSDISLEPIPTGYRMAAEGEQIIIEIQELDAFRDALADGRFKRRSSRLRGVSPKTKSDKASSSTVTSTATKDRQPQGFTQRGLALIDGTLDRASKKWGSYLPDWVFTRAMFTIVFGALLMMLVFPGAVALFLLIVGAALIVCGAIAYSDPMLASRWLPGRTTPSHVLLFGVAIVMMGVLLGIIAN